MNKSLVLVHLGPNFFDYINDCISQIRKFNQIQIFLIINQKHFSNVEDESVILVDYEKLEKTKNHQIFDFNNKLDTNFRDGFWKFTTERFFYIEDLMFKLGLENVFHIENDNLIYFNIDELLNVFNENYEITTVFDSDSRAVPSLVYIRDINSISKFNHFVNKFQNKNDMELFSEYRNFVNTVINLPVLPNNYDLELKSILGDKTINKNQYFENFDKFKSIFDGAAIGQFLGGIDQRNTNFTNSTIGFINETTLFNLKNFEIFFELDEMERKIPKLKYKDTICRINNLHIHSKNLKKFLS